MNTLFDIYSTLLIIVYMTCMYLGCNTVQCDEYILDVVYSYIALILGYLKDSNAAAHSVDTGIS